MEICLLKTATVGLTWRSSGRPSAVAELARYGS